MTFKKHGIAISLILLLILAFLGSSPKYGKTIESALKNPIEEDGYHTFRIHFNRENYERDCNGFMKYCKKKGLEFKVGNDFNNSQASFHVRTSEEAEAFNSKQKRAEQQRQEEIKKAEDARRVHTGWYDDRLDASTYNNKLPYVGIYKGNMVNGKPQGNGTFISYYLDSKKYGSFAYSEKISGGQARYHLKHQYEGEWSNGLFQGDGTYTLSSVEQKGLSVTKGQWVGNEYKGDKVAENQAAIELAKKMEFLKNNPNSFMDSRDQDIYKTVSINGKIWMSENLRYAHPSWTSYKANGHPEYGYYYMLRPSEQSRKLCPSGWKLPTEEELKEALLSGNLPLGKAGVMTNACGDVHCEKFDDSEPLEGGGHYVFLTGETTGLYYKSSKKVSSDPFSQYKFASFHGPHPACRCVKE